ncbi:YceI family protein [Cognatiluteimonas profundi]|uniref:YceI family protein n=1 Tax=Cognatiluteimonas profundi TaxID=2594501 RepID=UPI003CCCAD43
MSTMSVRWPLFASLIALSTPAWALDYVQAPGSTLAFAGTYQGEVFTGRFPGFDTRLTFDPAHLDQASLKVAIPLASATTANADYDGEMRGSSFFDAGRFPQAQYTATAFRKLGGDRYAADGVLSLHGVSKPVTLQFTWTPGPRPVLSGKATVRRLDFGIGGGDWADTSLIPDDIAISTRVLLQPAR